MEFCSLFIPEVKLGCISSDVPGILLIVNGWVNELRNIGRRCKIILLSYLTQLWLNNRYFFIENIEAKITK